MINSKTIVIPDREENESDLTEAQEKFILRLCAGLNLNPDTFEIDDLGKEQASDLIEQLLELKKTGLNVSFENNIESENTVNYSPTGSSSKSALKSSIYNLLLIIAIVIAPYIFAWFTLNENYSTKAKLLAFGWLAFIVLLVFIPS